jgi:hypothetical protein
MKEKSHVMQRIAAAIMIVLGAGHFISLIVLGGGAGDAMLRWVDEGLWAAVPVTMEPPTTTAALENEVTFWAGLGSFSVPLTVLGGLLWAQARRGISPPPWVGWTLIAWFGVNTVLLVPSPSVLGVAAGVLLVLGARGVPTTGRSAGTEHAGVHSEQGPERVGV